MIIDGELKAVGVQSRQQALALVAEAPPKPPSAVQHAGLTMAPSARIAVHSAMIYLLSAGSFLALNGSFFLVGFARAAPLHLFGLGFLTFLIYGLGEHMLPRFTGNPIRSGAVAWLQLVLAHVGVLLMFAGFWFALWAVTVVGAVSAWLALALFAYRVWPVLWPRTRRPRPPVSMAQK